MTITLPRAVGDRLVREANKCRHETCYADFSSSEWFSSSLTPFLNSMILCPKALATEGKRLLNNSSTINSSKRIFQMAKPT